ncbi:MAG: CDGSH iron-sulfur domain-containing protein [Terriglobales bacterium]
MSDAAIPAGQLPPVRITIRRNGPLRIEGPFTLIDSNGQEIAIHKPVVSLCRCGQSADKPFCDGTHKTCGFLGAEAHILAAEAALAAPSEAATAAPREAATAAPPTDSALSNPGPTPAVAPNS